MIYNSDSSSNWSHVFSHVYDWNKSPTGIIFCFQALFLIVNAIYFGSYQFLSNMARPTYSETGALIDGGIDLNMYEGMAEYVWTPAVMCNASSSNPV